MRLLLAPDSFKGCLSAAAACEALAAGVRRVLPGAAIASRPLADGGEGFAEAMITARGGRWQEVAVCGPLPAPRPRVPARLGWLDGETAVLEMASASGLPLVSPQARDPLRTTSYGTGELIAAALAGGARQLIVGLGGSATNDLGAGMAQALGLRFLRADGTVLPAPLCGADLAAVAALDLTGLHPGLARCRLQVACDVDNPLLGPRGATAVFGPQKGGSPAVLERLEHDLARVAGLLEAVLEASGFAAALAEADLVITGEGRLDGQSADGKTVSGVARAAAAAGVPVVAIGGAIGPGAEALYPLGVGALLSLVPGPMALEEAMERGPELLADAAERLLRLVLAVRAMGPASPSGPGPGPEGP